MGKSTDAAKGALGGAASGAVIGSVVPGIGTLAGAGLGAVAGGALGYLSSGGGAVGGGRYSKINIEHPDFQYGGVYGGANKRGTFYDDSADYYQSRPDTQADYGQANADYAQQQQARDMQLALGSQYQGVIDGTAPSLAQMQLQRGQEDTNQAALNMAASARGGGGMLAQQQAMAGAALGGQRVSADAAMLRAQEVGQARDAYGNLLSGIRGGDMQSRGQSADQAQAQAGIQLQSEQQRYGQAFGYRQAADAVRSDQRDANIGIEQSNQSARVAAATGAAQAAATNRAATAGLVGSALGAGASIYTGGGKKLWRASSLGCRTPTAPFRSRVRQAR
jgi:hypothetical protein